jgi:hypothetical protein
VTFSTTRLTSEHVTTRSVRSTRGPLTRFVADVKLVGVRKPELRLQQLGFGCLSEAECSEIESKLANRVASNTSGVVWIA